MIDVTGADLVKFAQAVYRLSAPRGLGYLDAQAGELPAEDAKQIVERCRQGNVALRMDYVRGRGCKMTVLRNGDRLEIRDTWYDHTDADLKALLEEFGKTPPPATEHGMSCECADCARRRPANV